MWNGSTLSSPDVAEQVAGLLKRHYGFTPVIATELEFYLHGPQVADERVISALSEATSSLPVAKIEKERGAGQYEIALSPLASTTDVIAALESLKAAIIGAAGAIDLKADFAAKPLAREPGSGLHIHVHLEDAKAQNVFFKRDNEISDALKHSLGGLLSTLPHAMPVFAPREESYLRFMAGGAAPTTFSWGANNRTVALRLPDIGAPYRHIEHRVPGADADGANTIAAILAGIHHGLKEKCDPGAQVYGDASLPQYKLKILPRSLREAKLAGIGPLANYGVVP